MDTSSDPSFRARSPGLVRCPRRLGHLEVYTTNANGSDIAQITFTPDPGFSGFPSWGKWYPSV